MFCMFFFSLLMLGFRFYSVFMCVCFFPECFVSFFSFLCVYMFFMMSRTSCVFNKYYLLLVVVVVYLVNTVVNCSI